MEKLIEIYIELHITDHIATTTGQNYIEIKKKYKRCIKLGDRNHRH